MRETIDLRGDTESGLVREVLLLDRLYDKRNNPNELMAVLVEDYLFTWWQVHQLIGELDLRERE